jgi:hypothetical protein
MKNKASLLNSCTAINTPSETRRSSAGRSPNYSNVFRYNKWYIKPSIRMKKSLAKEFAFEERGITFYYFRCLVLV